MPVSKTFSGSTVEYSIVPINESDVETNFSIIEYLKKVLYENVEGVIADNKFYSMMDNFEEPRNHWSLQIVADYETDEPWVLVNKKPGDLYHPMSYICKNLTYTVTEFDIWKCDECEGPIAVVTEIDRS